MRSLMTVAVVLLIAALGTTTPATAQDRKFLTCHTLDQMALQLDTIVSSAQPLNEDPALAQNGCYFNSFTSRPHGPNYQVLVQLWYNVDANGLFFEVEYVETQGRDTTDTQRFFRLIATRSITEWDRPGVITSGAVRRGPWLGALSVRGYAGPYTVQSFVDAH